MYRRGFVALCLLVIVHSRTICAAETINPPNPKSTWVPLYPPRDGQIRSLTAKDGFVAWLEEELDEKTATFVAPTFFYSVFRANVGNAQPSLLFGKSSTRPPLYLLARQGVVLLDSIPGEPRTLTIFRPGEQRENVDITSVAASEIIPYAIHSRGWFCTVGAGREQSLIFIPAERFRPLVDRRLTVQQPFIFAASSQYPNHLHWNETQLLYPSLAGRTSVPAIFHGGKTSIRWEKLANCIPFGIDGRYAYLVRPWSTAIIPKLFGTPKQILRARLDAPDIIEIANMLDPLGRDLAFEPPFLIGMFQRENRRVLLSVDIESGEATHAAPIDYTPKSITGDILSSSAYAVDSNTIFRIPLQPMETPIHFLEWSRMGSSDGGH